MKKYWWILVVVLMLGFWTVNFLFTQYALVNLIGVASFVVLGLSIPWAMTLPVLFTLIDMLMIWYMFQPSGDNPVDPVLLMWLLSASANALLIGWVLWTVFHLAFALTVFIGVCHLTLRAYLFIWGPVTFVLR